MSADEEQTTAPGAATPGPGGEAEPLYLVVVNHDQQYSIWPAGDDLPAGWSREGVQGTREECLGHIGEVWVDMRPLSMRSRGRPRGPARSGDEDQRTT